ncbi:uncharacterized protein DSM5745_07440 [Aspergillus mulundensis]|uniref:DNA replication checkpoint mediator MRC1 domain-containing protein n=1 Tax=Aspergillus mulundensis TaxID=1810919 RepID=A0A3D8REC4_9EURO|nr:Uncharacterized protein DSM5745_07440 [Aspergillus mulundensis]RDW72268.1 Uncharacterized protein DSM5745_07440 [Aspergillus mulundensis]
MSSPSTPRSTRSASAAANSPEMLTPGRKIKAMLAAFDSDSDSESEIATKPKSNAKPANSPKENTKTNTTTRPFNMDLDEEDEDSDEDIIMPRGRMAARLQGQDTTTEPRAEQPPAESAFERVLKSLRAEKKDSSNTRREAADDDEDEDEDSDDELPAAGPRRRAQKTRDEDEESIRSQSRARSYSPLFMSSPAKSPNGEQERGEASGSEDEKAAPKRNSRFLELVAQKRKEREEKERAEADKKAAKAKEREALNANMFSDDESANDSGSGKKKAPKKARPARKAGKKALEDMNRETQRMSRNMQLAHEAQTKKKITKESFFARFNFMQPQGQTAPEQPGDNSSTTAGSQHSSDVEAHKDKETPQTSPILSPADAPDDSAKEQLEEDFVFPTAEELLNAPAEETQEVFGEEEDKTAKPSIGLSSAKKGKLPLRAAPMRVRLSRDQVARHQKDDSDSDLEIVTSPAKCRRIAAFENLPARNMQEPASMFKLKALAQLTSPSRKSTTMNSAELSASLLYQAKVQAGKERRERIEELRAKGVIIETAAERAAFEDEVENLVEKARQEGEQIAKQERAAAKKENGGDDDDSDFELSGSEDEGEGGADPEEDDEEDEDEEEEEDEEMEGKPADQEGNLIDAEAGEDESDEDDGGESEDEMAAEPQLEVTTIPTQRRKRPTRVLSDDEDEEDDQTPKTPAKPINPFVNSVERPNIPVKPSEATMSLTQAFAGTLATSQDMSQPNDTIPNSLPEPVSMSIDRVPESQIIVKDSQEQRAGSTDPFTGHWRAESRVPESPAARSVSQMSQIPDPTQDAGFVFSPFDPNKRFMGTPPHSTIETVLVEQSNSPVAARKIRNLKRGKAPQLSAVEEQEEGDFEIDASAFDVMKKASNKAKKQAELFDRQKSKAKDVVEEAAEESDDEYAGLGGASDDDADDEENAYDRAMINDNSGEKVDAKQLAALNALHQRNADEKDVAKLLKDITTGALRRRRNNDDEFDLDDSDDELLARRRQKQREFARMRNALLADGKVGELAENPKKAAFFKAIEDRDDDDAGLDFLGYEQESARQDESQDTAAETAEGDSTSNKRKRPLEPAAEDVNNRPPPHLRRKPAGAMSKKPATLAEIRETLSFLTERPEYDSFQEDASVDDDEAEQQHADADADDNEYESEEPLVTSRPREQSPATGVSFAHPRRTRGPVVDRLALLRQASSNSASTSNSTRLAFHTGAASEKAASFGFKPPILRKTTTASSSSSSTSTTDSSRGVTKAPGATVAKKGSVNYYTAARERERERQLRTQHRNRGSNIEALLTKHAGNRAGMGALGGAGQWE